MNAGRTVVLPTCSPGESVVVMHAAGAAGLFLPIVVLLDTGSDTSLLTLGTARALGLPTQGPASELRPMTTVGREAIYYRPAFIHLVAGWGQTSPVGVSVLGGVAEEAMLTRDLVGRDFLRQFVVTWRRDVIELQPGLEEIS